MPPQTREITYKKFLNLFTTAPHETVDEYYRFYKLGHKSRHGIPAELVAEYLEIQLADLEHLIRKTLKSPRDYITLKTFRKSRKTNSSKSHSKYRLSLDGFDRICMVSDTKKGKEISDLFIANSNFIEYYKDHIADKLIELEKSGSPMLVKSRKVSTLKHSRNKPSRKTNKSKSSK
jgi:phage anti-repressor protein